MNTENIFLVKRAQRRDKDAYHITGYDRVVDVDEIQSLLLLVKPGEEPVSVDIQ